MKRDHDRDLAGAIAGVLRRMNGHGKAEPHGTGAGEQWGVQIEACIAEQRVAEWANVWWHGAATQHYKTNPADCGLNLEVRWTRHDQGHLIIHSTDHPDKVCVLVTGEWPNQKIKGWMLARTAFERDYLNNGKARKDNDDHWVPQEDLTTPDVIPLSYPLL